MVNKSNTVTANADIEFTIFILARTDDSEEHLTNSPFTCRPISVEAIDQAQASNLDETITSNASTSLQTTEQIDQQLPQRSTTQVPKSNRQGSAHIHLWQFLKELLAAPQTYGTAIRWLDRNKGVFKIEDSVRVARLWGRRKNRPAMNYDKLSRSIRQYYKKGIMKKTERSQRLVYQFCHPYCM